MKYDKVTVFGIFACMALFFFGLYVNSRLMPRRNAVRPRPAAPSPAAAKPAPAAETAAPPAAKPAVAPDRQHPAAATPPAAGEAAEPTPLVPETPFAELGEPHELVQENKLLAVTDTAGGGIRHVDLLEYVEDYNGKDGKQAQPVRLGNSDYPLLALRPAPGWRIGAAVVKEKTSRRLVVERPVNDGDIVLRETWSVRKAPYELGYALEVRNASATSVTIPRLRVEAGALPPSTSPDRRVSARGGVGAGGGTVALPDGSRPKTFSLKAIRKMKGEAREQLMRTPVSWVAVHSKYFLFCVLPEAGRKTFSGCALAVRPPPEPAAGEKPSASARDRYQAGVFLAGATIPPGETRRYGMRAYAGPKKYALLHKIGNRIEAVMAMDRFMMFHPAWMGLLSRGILACLIRLNGLFGGKWGYGFAIIFLTVGVKLLFWPLSHRSTKSMRKMQKLQPQLKELREKYKDDPQKMYRKQQELFKENNVSQFGSCLPIFFQIPVFFALFNTFRNAIELRQAAFLWATDLSLPDTLPFTLGGLAIRPFAILMGLTMIAQQKLMPSADPNQARMMTFMSLFFIVLFYSMPSALTLYMTVNQVLTVIQTLVTTRLEKEKGD